jgi:O-antigen/teichoic acid export membrane protein
LLKQSAPFAIAGVLATVQLRLGLILLEPMAGAAVTGQYAAASRFVEAGRMAPQALFVALFPALAALRSDPAAMDRLFRRIMTGLFGYGLLFGLLMLALAPSLIGLTYGPRFDSAGLILRLLAWALLPAILKGCRILYCYARGQEAYVNRVLGLALLLQAVLILWGLPRFGAVGVALALLISESAALLLLWRIPKTSVDSGGALPHTPAGE